jgi:hypothetical protein
MLSHLVVHLVIILLNVNDRQYGRYLDQGALNPLAMGLGISGGPSSIAGGMNMGGMSMGMGMSGGSGGMGSSGMGGMSMGMGGMNIPTGWGMTPTPTPSASAKQVAPKEAPKRGIFYHWHNQIGLAYSFSTAKLEECCGYIMSCLLLNDTIVGTAGSHTYDLSRRIASKILAANSPTQIPLQSRPPEPCQDLLSYLSDKMLIGCLSAASTSSQAMYETLLTKIGTYLRESILG